MKKQIRVISPIVILASAAILPLSAQAVDVKLSGQINRLLMYVDNGNDNGLVNADNSVSGTRWRLKGSGDIGNGVKAGVYFENQLQSNRSSAVSIGGLDTDGSGNVSGGQFTVRHANVWFKGDFGKITLGQGNGAANGSTEADKSGTDVVQYAGSSADLLGGMEYGTSGKTVGDFRNSFDGLSRNDNIRYDGGSGPFGFAVSVGNGDKAELGLKFKTSDLEVRVAAWDESDSRQPDGRTGSAISASWDSGSGFNLTGAWATDDRNSKAPTNYYVKAGYKMGSNAFAIDYSETSDLVPGVDAQGASIAWVNNMMKGVQVYASYRVETVDNVANDDDVTAVIAGARVKF